MLSLCNYLLWQNNQVVGVNSLLCSRAGSNGRFTAWSEITAAAILLNYETTHKTDDIADSCCIVIVVDSARGMWTKRHKSGRRSPQRQRTTAPPEMTSRLTQRHAAGKLQHTSHSPQNTFPRVIFVLTRKALWTFLHFVLVYMYIHFMVTEMNTEKNYAKRFN